MAGSNRMPSAPPPGKVHFAGEQDESTACGRDLTGPITRLPEVTFAISAVTCAKCRRAIAAAERRSD